MPRLRIPRLSFRLPRRVIERRPFMRDSTQVSGTRYIRPEQVVERKAYLREDVGAPGRGPKLIPPLRKGVLTEAAIDRGYLKRGERIGDMTEADLKSFAVEYADAVGARRAFGRFHAVAQLTKRTNPEFSLKMEAARDAIGERFGKRLTPKEAIAARRRMG